MIVLGIGSVLAPCSSAQGARETATQAIRLQLFGMGSYANQDYGEQRWGGGFVVGGSAGFNLRGARHLEPALDVRYSRAVGSYVSEGAFSAGPRLTWNLQRIHPYGNFLIGVGTIYYHQVNPFFPDYRKDNSLVPTYGGGVDVDVSPTLAVRAEVQAERWRVSEGLPPFHPIRVNLGLRYQFRFGNRYGPE
jgi:opacity protein-like surface antigen